MPGLGSQSGEATSSGGGRAATGSDRLNRNVVTFFGLSLSQNIPPRTVARLLRGSFLRSLVNVFSGLQLPAMISMANEIAGASAGERSGFAIPDSGSFVSLFRVAQLRR